MKVTFSLFTFILLFVVNPKSSSATSAETGSELRDECRSVDIPVDQTDGKQAMGAMSCISYSQGVVDGWILAGHFFCKPTISLGDQAKVVKNYLDGHPEELNLQPAELVIRAINRAWPCK